MQLCCLLQPDTLLHEMCIPAIRNGMVRLAKAAEILWIQGWHHEHEQPREQHASVICGGKQASADIHFTWNQVRNPNCHEAYHGLTSSLTNKHCAVDLDRVVSSTHPIPSIYSIPSAYQVHTTQGRDELYFMNVYWVNCYNPPPRDRISTSRLSMFVCVEQVVTKPLSS